MSNFLDFYSNFLIGKLYKEREIFGNYRKKRKKNLTAELKPKWIQQRQQEIKKEQEEYNKQKGEYYTFPVGESKIKILDNPPEKRTSKWGTEQWLYMIEVNNEIKKLTVNVILDRAVIQALSEGINPMTIIRTGKGKATRYSIKELETT